MVTQEYTISTVKNAVPPRVKMSQYDTGSRTIVFSVVDGSGTAVDLTGLSVTVEGTRIDGHAFATACTVDDNTASFTESVDMTNVAGDHPAELVIRESGQRLGTMNFVISVEPCAMDDGANLTNEDLPLYQQLFKGLASAPMIYNGASGSVAAFSDGADGYPLKGLTVAVEPKQSGSGDPSPSNIRPISGWDEVKITRTGKNIIPDDAWVENYLINASGEVASSSSYKYCEKYIKVNPSTTYIVSFNKTATGSMGVTVPMYDANKVFLERQTAYTGTNTGYLTGTVTTTAETAYIRITVPKNGGSDYQMEQGSTATTHEPYTDKEYTISIGETVYGGTLDVVGGKMIADRKAVDMGSLTWSTATKGYYAALSDARSTKVGGDVNALCSCFKRVAYNSGSFSNGDFCVCDSNFSGSKRILASNTAMSTAADFKASVTGQTLVYTLATPVEIALTPQQITTLLGGNNIWADAGAVSVEHPCDTKLYITNAIAAALATV